MKRLLSFFFPAGSLRRKALKKLLVALHLRSPIIVGYYNTWYQQQLEHPALLAYSGVDDGPLISVIIPAFNPQQHHFLELVYTIASQAYQNWELIIVNASTDSKASSYVHETTQLDKRIQVIDVENEGISANTNVGISKAKGEFIAFVDHDDLLDTSALYEVVRTLKQTDADIVYSDEDKVSDNSEVYFDPHFKPEWSPDLLTHVNYMNHLTVIRKAVLDKVGVLDPDKDGAQDYDLLLRATDMTNKIAHIPKVLYHWRSVSTSTAQDFSSKPHIKNAAQKALQDHFERLSVPVEVLPQENRPGFYSLRFTPAKSVSLIVPPFASDALLRLYVGMLLNDSDFGETQLQLIVPEGVAPRREFDNVTINTLPATDNFFDEALHQASHETLVVINQIALPMQSAWLEPITGLMQLNHVCAATPVVVRDGAVIEDAGLVKGPSGQLQPLFKNEVYRNNQTYFGNTDWVRDVDALSGNFIVARKAELTQFADEKRAGMSVRQLLQEFTERGVPEGRYCVVYGDLAFDNYSIRLMPSRTGTTHLNPNLLVVGGTFELYTPETSAINILLRLQEARMKGAK